MFSFITNHTLPSTIPSTSHLPIDLLFLIFWAAVRCCHPGTCSLLPGIFFTAVPFITILLLPKWIALTITLIFGAFFIPKYLNATDPHATLRNAWGATLVPGLIWDLTAGLFFGAICFIVLWSFRRVDAFFDHKSPERKPHAP